MKTAFENANKEWAMELMVLVADRMLKLFDDDITLPTLAIILYLIVEESTCQLLR